MPGRPSQRPLVSVVLATYNEIAHVRASVDSLLAQDTPGFAIEILAIDGGSDDGTHEYLESIAARHPEMRVFSNPHRRAPFAFNIGIREARGEYVCIFGSHTIYKSDYIAVCLNELIAKNAIGCGGRVLTEPSVETLQARLVAWTVAHPFGSSGKSFRTQPEGFSDSANYIIVARDALIAVGGYSESLLRNEDNDLNQKLCADGGQLYCTWKTHCVYNPKETVSALLRYGYMNGFWNVISFRANPDCMGLRHFVPFFFVLALLGAASITAGGLSLLHSSWRFLAFALPVLLAMHLGAGLVAAVQAAVQRKSFVALLLPLVFLGFHFAYGLGTLVALITNAHVRDAPQPTWLASEGPLGEARVAEELRREESA